MNYYKRYGGWKGFSFRLPYIVYSRRHKNLLKNLLKEDHPVLLEGIHCTYFMDQLKSSKLFVRLHNVEFEYYLQLARNEMSFFKKYYYYNESRLLKTYEKKIASKANFFAITNKDVEKYKSLGASALKYLPAFLPYTSVTAKEGKGSFCLYHGNLSVAENEKSATWLCKNIFNELNISLVIAGKNPSEKLMLIAKQNKNISVIGNPSEDEMDTLIAEAQINILPSFNSTGIKIKLLNSLFNGRHCIVNTATVEGTGLESLCHITETEEDFKEKIIQLFNESFTTYELERRTQLLEKRFNNKINAELLIQWIY